MQRATELGGRAIATPRASSTSAEPVLEEAARPPCLQTGTPAPATTSAAIVETFIVPAVPAGPAGVNEAFGKLGRHWDYLRHFEHCCQHARQLLDGFTLAPQPKDERGHLRRRGRSLQYLA